MALDAVVLDLGEVLTGPPDHLELAALSVGADPVRFATAWRDHRPAYDLGTSATAYWTLVLRAAGVAATSKHVRDLDALDVAARTLLADGVEEFLHDLHDHAPVAGLLSNAPISLATAVRSAPWAEAFDVLVFSSDPGVGVAKPDPRAYAHAEAALGRPGSVLFLDDREVNVAAARAAGWDAEVWPGVDAARRLLADRGAG